MPRQICYYCELISLDFERLGSDQGVNNPTRKCVFCEHCTRHPRLSTAKRCLERNIPINQLSLVEFIFNQFSWNSADFGRPLAVRDIDYSVECLWCDDCYVKTFDEYTFFEVESGELVFYYRFCDRCKEKTVNLPNGHSIHI